jgi:hypothetical protein
MDSPRRSCSALLSCWRLSPNSLTGDSHAGTRDTLRLFETNADMAKTSEVLELCKVSLGLIVLDVDLSVESAG